MLCNQYQFGIINIFDVIGSCHQWIQIVCLARQYELPGIVSIVLKDFTPGKKNHYLAIYRLIYLKILGI